MTRTGEQEMGAKSGRLNRSAIQCVQNIHCYTLVLMCACVLQTSHWYNHHNRVRCPDDNQPAP